MLSQKEIEYLRSPENFPVDYSYVLKHKIKNKVKALNDELVLLERAGLIEFSKITEISKSEPSSNQASFKNLVVGLPGFEPESIEPKSTSLDQASREPHCGVVNIISAEP